AVSSGSAKPSRQHGRWPVHRDGRRTSLGTREPVHRTLPDRYERWPMPWLRANVGVADPVGEGGAVEFDAFAGIDDGLAVQRGMVAVLRDQHMRDQARPGCRAALKSE